MLRILFFTSVLLFTLESFAQPGIIHEFGKPSLPEVNMNTYPKDTLAKAVVLFETGNYTFEVVDYKIVLVKKVYRKLKVLQEDAKNLANIAIPLYNNSKESESLIALKAVTTNKNGSDYLQRKDIFNNRVNGRLSEITFAFPNVQNGSVLEYEYTVTSPFIFNLEGWSFQNNFPTVYSEFKAEIPGFYHYNRTLIGDKGLDINHAEIKKNCFEPVKGNLADCEILTYAMSDIPAFIEEDFMLSKMNYLNRLDFQLKQAIDQRGNKHMYTKNWKTVDREFKKDKNIGLQTRKNNFLSRQLPESISNINDPLEKAKSIYSYIQNHFTWNNSTALFSEADVKKAFNEKVGSAAEINLALINALQAEDLDAEIGLLSTRNNGIPTKEFAVISDFNYLVAHLKINGETFLLDATDKYIPFGTIPFKCLNYQVRVMDFKEGSYWEPVHPNNQNVNHVNIQIEVDENYNFIGKLRETNKGYNAISKRRQISETNKEGYLRQKEAGYSNLEIATYKIKDQQDIDKPISEDFEFTFTEKEAENLIFDPFLFKSFEKNPFQLNNRHYAVDFGHPRTYSYLLSLNLNEKYTFEELPENKSIQMPNNMGEALVTYSENNGIIHLRFSMNINQYHFDPQSYDGLKSFFNHVVQIQNNSPIVLKKLF